MHITDTRIVLCTLCLYFPYPRATLELHKGIYCYFAIFSTSCRICMRLFTHVYLLCCFYLQRRIEQRIEEFFFDFLRKYILVGAYAYALLICAHFNRIRSRKINLSYCVHNSCLLFIVISRPWFLTRFFIFTADPKLSVETALFWFRVRIIQSWFGLTRLTIKMYLLCFRYYKTYISKPIY